MTTLQHLADTMHIRKIQMKLIPSNDDQKKVLREIEDIAERVIYPKLIRLASMIGEPLPVNDHASPHDLKTWITSPLLGYEITLDEVDQLYLAYHETDTQRNLYLIGKPRSNGTVRVEHFRFEPDGYLNRYALYHIRHSPDIGMFIEQGKNFYVAQPFPACWVQKRMYDHIELPWDFSIQSKTFHLQIPVGISYKETT